MGRVLHMFGMGSVLNMFGMGRHMAAAAVWGVRSIFVAWAALWLRSLYGARAQRVWHGPPQWGVCLICLTWAALWLRPPYWACSNMFGMGRLITAAALWLHICLAWAVLWLRPPYGACASYVWHGPPYGSSTWCTAPRQR
jgi:hypothetical protein